MLATIAFLALIAVAFWRESLKLLLAGMLALMVLGLIQVASFTGAIDLPADTPVSDKAQVATEPADR
ncbi:hypothetical protein [Haloechinothrix halophila]|uniref:hypothetical protein n=1 Tax=Haloechinothrix halophila TaxID=1069073 RepID=UPI00040B969A|nr:hypothetical protein [Haloechinothrix halophila]